MTDLLTYITQQEVAETNGQSARHQTAHPSHTSSNKLRFRFSSPRSAKAPVESPKRYIHTPTSRRLVDDQAVQPSTEPSNRRITPPDSMSLSTSSPIKFIDHDGNNNGEDVEELSSRHVSEEYGMSPNAINLKEKHSPVRKAVRNLTHPDTDKIFEMELEVEKKENMDRE